MIIYMILFVVSTRAQDVSSREEITEVRSAQSDAGGVRGCSPDNDAAVSSDSK